MNIDLLKEKYLSWPEERIAKDFYKGLQTYNDSSMKYAVEHDNNGYFLIQRDSATHFNLDSGEIHRIDCRFHLNDILCNKELYLRSIECNEFLVDIPIFDKIVKIKDRDYLYSIVQRPLASLGTEANIDIGAGLVNVDYLKKLVDDISVVMLHIKEVSNKYNVGFPSNGIYPTHRVRLKEGIYSWKTFRKWNSTLEDTINVSLGILKHFQVVSKFFEIGSGFNPASISKDIAEVQGYASRKWNDLNN